MSDDPWERPRRAAAREPSFRMSTRQLGVVVFLASLAVLFSASLAAFVATRFFHGASEPRLPPGLIASTILLIGVSATLHRGVVAIRDNKTQRLRSSIWLAGAFAVAFLIGQSFNWSELLNAHLRGSESPLYAYTFVMLTGLHALHVLGGFVPLFFVLRGVALREYSSSRYEGVRLTVQYWHFLLAVWLILLFTLWIFS